jgi:hypothetical protein
MRKASLWSNFLTLKHNGMRARLILAIALLCLFNSCGDPATSVIKANTFGSLLNDVFDRANQLIQQAQTSGLLLEINGGAQVQNLVITARDAFKDDLNIAVNDMSAQQQQLISELNGSLNKVQAGVADMTAALTQIALILPLSNKFPQLTKYKGTIVAPNKGPATVRLSGVFLDIPTEGYDASIKLNGKIFHAISKTTQQLEFSIPDSIFKFGRDHIGYIPFDIGIDYKKKGFFLPGKEVATFKLFFVLLPETFGTYSLETTETIDTTLFEEKTCGPYTWNTHNNNDDGVPKGCTMEDGWICDVNSVHPINFRGEEGRMNVDWFNRGNVSSPTAAMWDYLATTKHGFRGNYGGLTIDLAFKRYKRTQVKHVVTTTEQPLNWGDEKVLSYDPGGQWKLIFTQFDKTKKEIASADQPSPYVRVTSAGSRIEIKLAPFD